MPVTAKICGLSTPETLDAAIAGGASHVGFLFFPPSPRNLDIDQARALAARVPEHVGKVGVFVNPDDALLAAALPFLDVVQLHKSSPERAASIAKPVWAAVPVKTRADLDQAARFAGAAERILYDAKTPDTAALPGGMGLRFDWSLLQGYRYPLPWALSGGLDPANVAQAARTTGATLVDVSSGVESAPGTKDVDKIAAFLKAVASL
ncbi:MAG: phosphoribosylanthranilate isomerase [Sphingomonadales bacterium]|nr:MAG: phosphoribosylanthranilate isomerase [Sphingomonadales bacterium]